MTSRSHLWLRISAIALLAAMAVWPRAKAGVTADELAKSAAKTAVSTRRAVAAETTAARLVSAPRTTKLVVAQADESHLTN